MLSIAVESAAGDPSEAPTSTFALLGLGEPLCRALLELGYKEPTQVQHRTITRLLAGADIIAQAQTGTGKTAAFALPILQRLETGQRDPQALVLTPTRELAIQVAAAFSACGKFLPLSVLPVYGGQPIDRQLRPLSRGVQVVVGTPGRLLDHIRRGTLRLGSVRTVVLDEADEMLDMGFLDDIEAILQQTPEGRQTALFSATIPAPIAALSRRYLRSPERITVEDEPSAAPQIRQVCYEIGSRDKFEVLVRVLQHDTPASAIIFCRTRGDADALAERLAARDLPAEALHGDMNQQQRDRVMGRFRGGQVGILTATDVAARGLDIEQVSHVINYDLPEDPSVYIHRIGRTGRAGRTGCALTLLGHGGKRLLWAIERLTGAPVQRLPVPTLHAVVARQHEAFKGTLQKSLSALDPVDPCRHLAQGLMEEHDPTALLAAAFRLILGAAPDVTQDPLAIREPDFSQKRAGKRPEERPRDRDRKGAAERGVTRLFLNIGREDGVRPADLVGAIANEAGIPGRAIGGIELFPRFSFVEVPSAQAGQVMQALRNTLVRGRKVAPSVARPS